MKRDRFGSDRGSATVWSLGAMAVLCAVFGAVLALGQAVVVRHRAAGGADLAALAAAAHWSEGAAAACARAEQVAAAQGVRLARCAILGETSDVTATAGRGPFTAEARARAGPAGPESAGSGPVGPAPAGPGLREPQLAGPAPAGAGLAVPGPRSGEQSRSDPDPLKRAVRAPAPAHPSAVPPVSPPVLPATAP
jgi:secretion/DNA translocation related TadE-like protein